MDVWSDPRVKPATGVSDEAYEVHGDDGIWDVVQIDGRWVAAPPNGTPGGFRGSSWPSDRYQRWEDALPRYASPGEAIQAALGERQA